MADELTVSREGNTLVIASPSQLHTEARAGKTLVVASTRGRTMATTASAMRVQSRAVRVSWLEPSPAVGT